MNTDIFYDTLLNFIKDKNITQIKEQYFELLELLEQPMHQ